MPHLDRSTRHIFSWTGKIKDVILSTAQPWPVDMMLDSWRMDAERFRYFTNARPDARPYDAPFLFRNLSGFGAREDRPHRQVAIPATGFGAWFSRPRPGQRAMASLTPRFKQHLHHTVPYELIYTPGHDGKPSPDSPLSGFLHWLRTDPADGRHQALATMLETEMSYYPHALRQPAASPAPDRGNDDAVFLRFSAPLLLLDAALSWNATRSSPDARLTQLYIAQVALSDLPAGLQEDVPTLPVLSRPAPTPTHLDLSADPFPLSVPDIYASSLWLGLTPTFTPWHRDPNPNLFCQLLGRKAIRLMPPEPGKRLFREVLSRLQRQQRGQAGGVSQSAAIRGAEMMQGAERRAWEEVIWGHGDEAGSGAGSPGMRFGNKWTEGMEEAVLGPGDALYIPYGWWHSVRTVQKASADEIGGSDGQSMAHAPETLEAPTSLTPSEGPAASLYTAGQATWGQEPGELNASVNWWFRWRTVKEKSR
ncbi:hypothetical protein VTJ83DRAFT_5393 [Remersonia thermophila]|uniref:JmjC domain-containing protein n=1 Tax=Remersonia thermophila TaxID=72144 RepID=A0ABR4D6T3_9PEZI